MRTPEHKEAKDTFGLRPLTARRKAFVSDERGSLTIFSFFLFMMMLFIAGMAVDMVHQEKRRVGMQNAVDSAILAASSMSQELDATTLVQEYVAKAGYNAGDVTVTPMDVYSGSGAGLYSRSVSVDTTVSTNTMFMSMLGVTSLNSPVAGSAQESSENVEISLILDISGSMNWDSADATKTKLEALKDAANSFIDAVFESNDPQRVSINIIPYNQQVYVPNGLLSRLPVNNSTVVVSPVPSYTGALAQYQTQDPNAPCFIFDDADFQTLRLGETNGFNRASAFLADNYYWGLNGDVQQQYETPYEWARWCGNYYSQILPLSNDPVALKAHINGLVATGATAINIGMNWGLALLDADFQPIVEQMITANELDAAVTGRPFGYNATGTQKFVVLMTDGANTNQLDLKTEFKSGATRAWYSDTAGTVSKYNGYFVLMPDNGASRRWYVPGDPKTTADDQYLPEAALPADAVQLDYHELYQRLGYRSAAKFLFQHSDTNAYNAHKDAYEDVGGYGTADTRLGQLCGLARTNDRVKVFTVAFEAPQGGQSVLSNCAYAPGYYFDVDGTDIKSAFNSIAGQIALLRLTE
ncbi:MAG: pilus assembly protein [Silicimonas sp.]|nr:pilus assembly protein [Silicimonas sp.]